jgi:hypothetical protein
MWMKKIQN